MVFGGHGQCHEIELAGRLSQERFRTSRPYGALVSAAESATAKSFAFGLRGHARTMSISSAKRKKVGFKWDG